MNRRNSGWILFALFVLVRAALGQPVSPAAAKSDALPPLIATSEIQAMPAARAKTRPAASIEGIVTVSDHRSRDFFVEDDSGGIYCDVSRIGQLPPIGTRLVATGKVSEGGFRPVFIVESISILGSAPLPNARLATHRELWGGKFDGDRVRITGQALKPVFEPLPERRWIVPLLADGLQLQVLIPKSETDDNLIASLPGAQLIVDGVCGVVANDVGQPLAVYVNPSRRQYVSIATNRVEMAKLAASNTLAELMRSTNFSKPTFIRTSGRVCLTNDAVFIAEPGGGLRIHDYSGPALKLGDWIDVFGLTAGSRPERRLQFVSLVAHRRYGPPPQLQAEGKDLFDWKNLGQNMTVEAEFLHRIPRAAGDSLFLERDNRLFEARLAFDHSAAAPNLRAGSTVQASGILWYMDTGNPESPIQPRLLVNATQDLVVTSRPPWPMRVTLLIVSGLAAALTLGLLALFITHHRLKKFSRRIEQSDEQLRALNSELELRIRERTQELELTNTRLSAEAEERAKAQAALQDREGRLRTLVETVDAVVWEYDAAQNQFTYVSPQAALFGYSLEEWLVPGFWPRNIHPEDREQAVGYCLSQTALNAAHELQYRFATASGNYLWVDDKVAVLPQPDGTKLLRGVIFNITERRLREAALRESEERFAKAFNASPVITVITRLADARYVDVSEQFTRTLGYTREETLGKTSLELGVWADVHQRQQIVETLERGLEVRDWECEFRDKQGQLHTMLLSIERINVRGEPCLLGINHDISERKLSERLRDTQNAVLEMIAQGAPLGATLERLALAIESQSKGARCSILLYDKAAKRLLHGAAPSLPDDYNRAIHGVGIGPDVGSCGTAAYLVEQVIAEDIELDPRWTPYRDLARTANVRACWSTPILDSHQQLLGTFAIYYSEPRRPDAHAQRVLASATHTAAICIKSAADDASLRQQNELLQFMGQLAQVGAWSFDFETQDLSWTTQTYAIHDIEPGTKIDVASAINFYAPEARAQIAAAIDACKQDGTPWDLELPFITAKGRPLWVRAQGQAIVENGKTVRLSGAFQDITARRQTEQALRTSEERFQLAMRGANDGLWDWNLGTNTVYYSPRWKSMLGYDDSELEANLDTWKLLVDPDDRDRVMSELKRELDDGNKTFQTEFRMRHKDGHWVNILSRAFLVRDAAGTPERLVGTHVDITERKRAEESHRQLESQLRQAQKMEAIGTLAGGVAHDFNNLLGIIIGCAELARMDCAHNLDAIANLNDLLKASHRAKDLVRQILTFSRQQPQERKVTPFKPVVDESIRLLRAVIPASVALECHFQDPVSSILADEGLIQQVIINLVTNSVQAIGSRPGRIDVFVDQVSGTEPLRERHPEVRPGAHVRLQIRDNGCGMGPEIVERIFEPFFTTKAPGQGTGLGLSVVHGIVRSHDGCITVESHPGVGTVFALYLPVASNGQNVSSQRSAPVTQAMGNERVLLVDDEDALLRVSARILRNTGYEVTVCNNPAEALDIFRQSPNAFCAVITDLTMPGRTGDSLAKDILAIRPDVPILACTGYFSHMTREQALQLGFRDVLQKPIEGEQFCQAIRRAIDSPASSPRQP